MTLSYVMIWACKEMPFAVFFMLTSEERNEDNSSIRFTSWETSE